MPSFMPQGSGSTTAEAGVAPMAPRPATPAAAPKKPRREVSIFMDLFLLFLKVNSTPPRSAVSGISGNRRMEFNAETQRTQRRAQRKTKHKSGQSFPARVAGEGDNPGPRWS